MWGGSTIEELPDGNNSGFVSLHAHTSRLIIGEAKPEKLSMVVQQHLYLWKPAFPSAEEPQQAEGRVNSFTLTSQPLGKNTILWDRGMRTYYRFGDIVSKGELLGGFIPKFREISPL